MVFINYYLEDGRVITSAKKPSNNDLLVPYEFVSKDLGKQFESINIRKVKISVPSYGIIPKDKQGGGHKAWTFIDEIIIE